MGLWPYSFQSIHFSLQFWVDTLGSRHILSLIHRTNNEWELYLRELKQAAPECVHRPVWSIAVYKVRCNLIFRAGSSYYRQKLTLPLHYLVLCQAGGRMALCFLVDNFPDSSPWSIHACSGRKRLQMGNCAGKGGGHICLRYCHQAWRLFEAFPKYPWKPAAWTAFKVRSTLYVGTSCLV